MHFGVGECLVTTLRYVHIEKDCPLKKIRAATDGLAQRTILYDERFFAHIREDSYRSATVLVPLVMELLRPTSVIDVGCGHGFWLRAFAERGVALIRGIDGEYVERSKLLIEPHCFTAADLSQPFRREGHYDLAVCLEVAEHLPTAQSRSLVGALTESAPAVLFSAAFPGQGGTGHVNEQWPSYWRDLFAEAGFRMFDCLRPHIQGDERVDWWYRHNIFIFANPSAISRHPLLTGCVNDRSIISIALDDAGVTENTRETVIVSKAQLRAFERRFAELEGVYIKIPTAHLGFKEAVRELRRAAARMGRKRANKLTGENRSLI